jgi:hypothetical protein
LTSLVGETILSVEKKCREVTPVQNLPGFRRVAVFASMAVALLLGEGCPKTDEGPTATPPSVPAEPSGTALRLQFVDEEGGPVSPATAEVLCVAWGNTERLPLQSEADQLDVPLDEAWLRDRWPVSRGSFHHCFLYFAALGYGSIRSAPFFWIGGNDPEGTRVGSAEVSLSDGSGVTVPEGEGRSLTVVFHRPRPRCLKFADAEGNSISGIQMKSFMFWSRENHCAVLCGADPLGEGVSDGDGRIEVPYGDFEYAFVLERTPWVLTHPTFGDPWLLLTSLSAEETVVQIREQPIRPLNLRVAESGVPVPGAVLYARLANAYCSANWGELAHADAQGRIALPNFRPEKYEEIYFTAGDVTRAIWTADPRTPRFGGVVAGDLADRP